MKVILSRKCFDSTAGISKPTTFIAILILITLALLSAVCGMRLYGDIEKETCFGLGCDPRDVAADGMVCHNGGSYYVANKPTNGCITKIDGKGRKIIVYRNSRLGETGYISKMNIWNGWIYFAVMNEGFDMDAPGVTRYGEFRRVKIGSGKDERIDEVDFYYQDGSGNAVIAGGKLYYTSAESMDDYDIQLIECNLDGSDKRILSKDAGWGKFAINDDGIYYNENSGKGDIDYNIVKRTFSNIGKPEIVAKGYCRNILYSGGKLYCAIINIKAKSDYFVWLSDSLYSVNLQTGEKEQIKAISGKGLRIDALTDDGSNIVAAMNVCRMEDVINVKEKYFFIDKKSKKRTKVITKILNREALNAEGRPSVYDIFVLGNTLYYHCNFERDDEFYDDGPEKPVFEEIDLDQESR